MCLFAGSGESPELASVVALRLPASCLNGRWEDMDPPPGVMLRLPRGTTGFFFFFFLRDKAILSFLRNAGKSCSLEIALIKANSSCLRMVLRQELLFTTRDTEFLI